MEEKRGLKEKATNLFDSAVVTLIASALLIIFTYSYNCGYNSYFGIPIMFTNASWEGIAYRIPQISDAIFLLAIVCFFLSLIINIFKLVKKKSIDNRNKILTVLWLILIFLVILEIFAILLLIYKKSIINIVLNIPIPVLLGIILIVLFKQRKAKNLIRHQIKATEKNPEKLSNEDIEELRSVIDEIGRQDDRSIEILETWPKSKVMLVPIVCSLISLLFMIFFFWGTRSAYNQTTFCFLDENRIIISTNNTNVIAISVEYSEEKAQYVNQNYYEILPQENLKFTVIECGKVFSNVELDKNAWSLPDNLGQE